MELSNSSLQYELIVKNFTTLPEDSKSRVLDLIETDLDFSQEPVLLAKSSDFKELESLKAKLESFGVPVLILTPKSEASKLGVSYPGVSDGTMLSLGAQPFKEFYQKYTAAIYETLQSIDVVKIQELINLLLKARDSKKQIFIFGNGGSAATASHFANDFSNIRTEDSAFWFKVLSLNENVSVMTATSNDYGYEQVFANQLKPFLNSGDLVIAISSSGNSANIIKAVEYANSKGAHTFGVVGFDGGLLQRIAKSSIYIPSKRGQYGYMEDVTLVLNHIVSIYIQELDLKVKQYI